MARSERRLFTLPAVSDRSRRDARRSSPFVAGATTRTPSACIATPLPFPERGQPYLDAGGSQPSPASKELPQREPAISSQEVASQGIEAPHAGGSAARLPPDFCSPYVVEAFKAEQNQLRSIILGNQEKSAADA